MYIYICTSKVLALYKSSVKYYILPLLRNKRCIKIVNYLMGECNLGLQMKEEELLLWSASSKYVYLLCVSYGTLLFCDLIPKWTQNIAFLVLCSIKYFSLQQKNIHGLVCFQSFDSNNYNGKEGKCQINLDWVCQSGLEFRIFIWFRMV